MGRQGRGIWKVAASLVVLGAAAWGKNPSPVFRERINHAIALYQSERVEKLIFTGGTRKEGYPSEGEVARKFAIKQGIPSHDILYETRSKDTYQNLVNTRLLIQKHKIHSVIIVSDAFHLARAEWLVNRHLKGKNVQFYASDSCGDSTPNYLRKLSREIPAWIKAMIMHR